MRKQYKQKKGSVCALCKPHKHGLAKRWRMKERPEHERENSEILKAMTS